MPTTHSPSTHTYYAADYGWEYGDLDYVVYGDFSWPSWSLWIVPGTYAGE